MSRRLVAFRGLLLGAALAVLAASAANPVAHAQAFQQPAGPDPRLSRQDVRQVVEALAGLLASSYVDSTRGLEAQRALSKRLRAGAYRGFDRPRPLVTQLMADVQSVIDDDHFNLLYFPPAAEGFQWSDQSEGPADEAAMLEEARHRLRGTNFGVAKAEILEGNVGWLTISKFDAPLALLREPLAAAFALLANTDALIVDLRRNPGGNPECVQLAFSYFVDGPSSLATTRYTRATGKREEFHTYAEPGGPKYLGRPVYVLVGPATGSGAEMFSYQMKHRRKGTLVGATTSGAAHSFNTYQIGPKDGGHFMVLLPDARMIDAHTGGDWEKVAVSPDVATSVDAAPAAALKLAIETLLAGAKEAEAKAALSAQLEKMTYAASRPAPTRGDLEKYAGRYGIRRVFMEGDALRYQRDNGVPVDLQPVAEDTFELNVPMTPRPRVRFEVEGGTARSMLLKSSGGEERIPRDP